MRRNLTRWLFAVSAGFVVMSTSLVALTLAQTYLLRRPIAGVAPQALALSNPPTCTGTSALQWDGADWACYDTATGGGADTSFIWCNNGASSAGCLAAASNNGLGTANYMAIQCLYNGNTLNARGEYLRYVGSPGSGNWQWNYDTNAGSWVNCDSGATAVLVAHIE